ncbi:hypothetical protein PHYSODRAFT_458823, partial [Phytophthora sojae]
LDDVYADLGSFFERIKMHKAQPCGASAKQPQSRIFVEVFNNYVVPFDLQKTEKVVWALKTAHLSTPNTMVSEQCETGEGTNTRRLMISIARHGVEMSVQVHIAVRRYIEEDRTVFISRMQVEPLHGSLIAACRETTRLVLEHGGTACGATTILRTHCQISDLDRPSHHDNLPDPSLVPASCYQRWVRAWEKSISDFNHRVEDALFVE